MADNILYAGDQNPSITATIKDGAGNIVDLTPYTGGGLKKVELALRQEYDTANKWKAAAAVSGPAVNGQVVYALASSDLTVTPGVYRGQWILTNATGQPQHVDAGRFIVRKAY